MGATSLVGATANSVTFTAIVVAVPPTFFPTKAPTSGNMPHAELSAVVVAVCVGAAMICGIVYYLLVNRAAAAALADGGAAQAKGKGKSTDIENSHGAASAFSAAHDSTLMAVLADLRAGEMEAMMGVGDVIEIVIEGGGAGEPEPPAEAYM